MMRMRTKTTELTATKTGAGNENEWEVRPGGMLVQKRDPEEEHNRIPPPTIRVRVKYRSIYHDIYISSQATFGELKKMLTGPTGLHHEDQKLVYKDKERDSKTFLDVVGVKDKSKMVLTEDPISQEKRYLEIRRNAKIEKAVKSISEISLEVDRLAGQVSALESVISKGGKVAEKMILNLIELLMNQLLKLDGIMADGDANLKKKTQVERVQRYVELLDILKIKNLRASDKATNQLPSQPRINQKQGYSNGRGVTTAPHQPSPQSRRSGERFSPVPPHQQGPSNKPTTGAVVVTTQWETFDSLPTTLAVPPSTSTSGTSDTIQPKFIWDLL